VPSEAFFLTNFGTFLIAIMKQSQIMKGLCINIKQNANFEGILTIFLQLNAL